MILKPTTVAENSSSNLFDHTMLSVNIKMDFESKRAQQIKISARQSGLAVVYSCIKNLCANGSETLSIVFRQQIVCLTYNVRLER